MMIGIVVAMQVAFAAFFLCLRSRMKAEAARRVGSELVDGKGLA